MDGSGKISLALKVTGDSHEVMVAPRKLLSDVLREDLRLTGTHVGCEQGVCGACTVLVDGRPARSCLTFAVQMDGLNITTIEGFNREDGYSPLQQALHEEHGLQCGFCTPGLITTFEAYLVENPDPTEAEVREALSGNLCRCTGYQNIVKGILKAARVMRGGSSGEAVAQ